MNFPKLIRYPSIRSESGPDTKSVNEKGSGIRIRSIGHLGALDAGPDAEALRVGDLARRLVVRDHAEQPGQKN